MYNFKDVERRSILSRLISRRSEKVKSISSMLAAILFMTTLAGCMSLGPKTVVDDSFDYTGALGDSWKKRMLYNTVRVRYGDTPIFLDVASVINQYSLETGVNASSQLARIHQGDTFVGLGAHGTYTDRPTITYIPLSGEKFARSLMRPLPPSAVMSMIEAGYPISYVLRVCAESVNGIKNRTVAGMRVRPADSEYYPLLERLQRIQNSGSIGLRVQKGKDGEAVVMSMRGKDAASMKEDTLAVRKVLGLDPASDEFNVVYGSMAKDDKELAVLTRSLLQIISNLGSQIEVPDEHVAAKIVNPTLSDLNPDGTPADPLIRIKSSASKPDNAFVAIFYQSHWFYIDNRDLRSKGLFSFLMFLFSLTETGSKEGAPVVTISAGG
jgi:hypothetical protein